MANIDEGPVHEVRPTTQEMKIPARFIPSPTVEPGHTFASVTDKISAIALTRRIPFSWYVGFAGSFMLAMLLLMTAVLTAEWFLRKRWGLV